MALTDNLVVKVKAESGQTVITDSVSAFSWSGGTGSAALINDGTYGYLWRVTGGTRTAALSGLGNWTDTTPKTNTIAMRFRVTSRGANYQRYAIFGQSANNGQVIGNAGTSTGNLRNTLVLGGSSATNHALAAYTTGDVITLVHRFAETGTTSDITSAWKNGGAGHPTPDATATNSVTSTTLALIYSEFGVAAGETLDILNFAAWNRALTDSEAASVADDITQLWGASNAAPTFPGPNIGNQTGTVGTALSANTVSDSFSDADALTFSAIGTWPAGVTVSSAGIISGAPTTAGTYSTLQVRATDTAAQTVDSDVFSFTISAAAPTSTIATTTGVAVGSIASKPLPKTAVSATTGAATGSITSVSGASSTAINATTGATVGTITSVGDTSSGTFTSEPLRDNTGALIVSKALNFVALYSDTTGALVVRKTGLSTNGAGVFSFSDVALTAGVTYRVDWEDVDGKRRMPRKAAA